MQNSDNFSVSGQNKSWFVTDSSSTVCVLFNIPLPTHHVQRERWSRGLQVKFTGKGFELASFRLSFASGLAIT